MTFQCNNCDIQRPIEELRVPVRTGGGGVQTLAPGLVVYLDMLLCSRCQKLYHRAQRFKLSAKDWRKIVGAERPGKINQYRTIVLSPQRS